MSSLINTNTILCLDMEIFHSALKAHLETIPPPYESLHCLQPEDFTNSSFGSTFLDHFDDTIKALNYGFKDDKPDRALNRDQWL